MAFYKARAQYEVAQLRYDAQVQALAHALESAARARTESQVAYHSHKAECKKADAAVN